MGGSTIYTVQRDRVVFAAIFAAAVTFFLYCWAVQPDRPPLGALDDPADKGWYGSWVDQSNYAGQARSLASGELPGIYWDYERAQPLPDRPRGVEVTGYTYGLGYPVLGVPFIWLGLEGDPFVIPDGIAFGAAACLIFAIARRFFHDRIALLVTAAVVFATPMVSYFVTPWNTTPTVIAILLALYIGVSGDRSWRVAVTFGVASSLAFSARYVDLLWITAVVSPVILLDFRRCARIIAVALMLLPVTAGVILWSQHQVFGSAFTTPLHYHVHNGKRGDDLSQYILSDVPEHAAAVFVTGQMTNGARTPTGFSPLLRNFFWLVLAPVGFVALLRRRAVRSIFREPAGVLVAAGVASLVASTFYLSWWAGGGDDIMFHNGRFFVSWFPLWGILAAIGVVKISQRAGSLSCYSRDSNSASTPPESEMVRAPSDLSTTAITLSAADEYFTTQ